jgi:ubiquinone/menaquinone biosynthesis C-methylase UbiE
MDLFSKQAVDYSKYRPHYPAELYRFLNLHCREHDRAWDVATGNGQAAIELAKSFNYVLATDLSTEQIALTFKHPNIDYRVMNAEDALQEPDESFDLITVATGLHWFDQDRFFKEADRVLKKGGVFAAWAYGFHAPTTPEIDKVLHSYYYETLKGLWKKNNQQVWNGYKDVATPFQPITTPKILMQVEWTLEEFLGYTSTWSAVQLYKDQHQADPTLILKAKLEPLWGGGRRNFGWKLGLIAGRK